ncbi:hypothetical protein [Burkholderia pseudomallei]|uniref:hypothetical protein n=1 Tax=Burkholderia pseudomallei TaxID=28450 RepID=UPI000979FA97|nr:hypothetical protein BGI48_02850 [Burkholderia pseudomallei]
MDLQLFDFDASSFGLLGGVAVLSNDSSTLSFSVDVDRHVPAVDELAEQQLAASARRIVSWINRCIGRAAHQRIEAVLREMLAQRIVKSASTFFSCSCSSSWSGTCRPPA